jgi:hypothetical protein
VSAKLEEFIIFHALIKDLCVNMCLLSEPACLTGQVQNSAMAAFEKFSIESLVTAPMPSSTLSPGASRVSWQTSCNSPAARHRRMMKVDTPSDTCMDRCSNADRVPACLSSYGEPSDSVPRTCAGHTRGLLLQAVGEPKTQARQELKNAGVSGTDEDSSRQLWSTKGVLRTDGSNPKKVARRSKTWAIVTSSQKVPSLPAPGGRAITTSTSEPKPTQASTGTAAGSARTWRRKEARSSGPPRRVQVSTVTSTPGAGTDGGGNRPPTKLEAIKRGYPPLATKQPTTSPQRVDRLLNACRSRRPARSEPAIVSLSRLQGQPAISVADAQPTSLAKSDAACPQLSIREWDPSLALSQASRSTSASSTTSSLGDTSPHHPCTASPATRVESGSSTRGLSAQSARTLVSVDSAALSSSLEIKTEISIAGTMGFTENLDGKGKIDPNGTPTVTDPSTPIQTSRDRTRPREDYKVLQERSAALTSRAAAANQTFSFASPPSLKRGNIPAVLRKSLERVVALERLTMEDESTNGWSSSHDWVDIHDSINVA